MYGRMTGSGTFDSELDGRAAVTHWEAVAHLPASAMQRQEAEPSVAAGASGHSSGECSNDGRRQADGANSGSTDVPHSAAAADVLAQHPAAAAVDATSTQQPTGSGANSVQQPAEVTILDLRPATGALGCNTPRLNPFQFVSDHLDWSSRVP